MSIVHIVVGWLLLILLLVNDVLFRLEFRVLFEMDLVLVSLLVSVGLDKLDRMVAGAGWRMWASLMLDGMLFVGMG